jgi:hypothetical protein
MLVFLCVVRGYAACLLFFFFHHCVYAAKTQFPRGDWVQAHLMPAARMMHDSADSYDSHDDYDDSD